MSWTKSNSKLTHLKFLPFSPCPNHLPHPSLIAPATGRGNAIAQQEITVCQYVLPQSSFQFMQYFVFYISKELLQTCTKYNSREILDKHRNCYILQIFSCYKLPQIIRLIYKIYSVLDILISQQSLLVASVQGHIRGDRDQKLFIGQFQLYQTPVHIAAVQEREKIYNEQVKLHEIT